jgi:hypothetical protein
MEQDNGRLRGLIKRHRKIDAKPRRRHEHAPVTAYRIAVAALLAFGVVAAAVTAIAIAESYSNLLAFALDHGLHGWRAAIAPAAVDSFVVMGELLLFASLLLEWDSVVAFSLGAGMAVWGFGLSVAGNVWHAAAAAGVDRAVAAIWPVTATAGLAGGLIIIKHVMASRDAGKTVVPAAAVKTPPPDPSSRTRAPHRPVTGGAARSAGLAPASQRERDVARRLVTAGHPLPSIRNLAAAEFDGSIRKAERTLKLAKAGVNGAGGGSGNAD